MQNYMATSPQSRLHFSTSPMFTVLYQRANPPRFTEPFESPCSVHYHTLVAIHGPRSSLPSSFVPHRSSLVYSNIEQVRHITCSYLVYTIKRSKHMSLIPI